jgi:integrase/recombinase XerD
VRVAAWPLFLTPLRPANCYGRTSSSDARSVRHEVHSSFPESHRNHSAPITTWTWSKVIRGIALRAGIPRFSTHTLRHLCLTDLARAGWELHAIATFAGHRSLATTLQYIHLSGRDLASKLAQGMAQVHAWRAAQLGELVEGNSPC